MGTLAEEGLALMIEIDYCSHCRRLNERDELIVVLGKLFCTDCYEDVYG